MSDDSQQRRDPITKRLLDLLYQSRKAKKWTVRDLAEKAGISPSYVSLIENGVKIPDAATIERLGRALDLDEKLLSAWVTVRGRESDTGKAIDAAHQLMTQLGVDKVAQPKQQYMMRELNQLSFAAHVSEPQAIAPTFERFVVGIPVYDEGEAPAAESRVGRDERLFWIDRRTLPDREELRGAWAWRLNVKGGGAGRGLYRRGSTVLMSPNAWSPEALHPRMVFAVQARDGVVLSRVSRTDAQLILLPTEFAAAEVLDVQNNEALRAVVLGRVILAVERYK